MLTPYEIRILQEQFLDEAQDGITAGLVARYERLGLPDPRRVLRRAQVQDHHRPNLVRTSEITEDFEPIPEMSDNLLNASATLYQALKANPRLTRNQVRSICESFGLSRHDALIAIEVGHSFQDDTKPSEDEPNPDAATITV